MAESDSGGIHRKEYDGDKTENDADSEIEEEEVVVKKPRKVISYLFHSFIDNLVDPQNMHEEIQKRNFTSDSLWVRRATNITLKGKTMFYNCTVTKKCPSKLQFVIDSILETGSILLSNDEHEHELDDEKEVAKQGIKANVKDYIIDYESKHIKVYIKIVEC